jgi:HTH-type transcriptional regulator, competence development regulator
MTRPGDFLKQLREKKGVSLREVERDTGISNVYLSQLETGDRQKLPSPERLKKIASYYNVTINELLQKAGYYGNDDNIEETYEQKIDSLFLHVTSDPLFDFGTRLKGKYDLDAKRFIIELYDKATGKGLLKTLEDTTGNEDAKCKNKGKR